MSVEEVSATGVLDVIQQRANTQHGHTRGTSRAAVLWLQYMEMVDILRTSIKVKRTANWKLHLQAVTILRCIGSQPLSQLHVIISSVNEQSS